MRMPSHIKISRHGIYYFRIVIPERLRLYFCGKLEIKKSLKTTIWRNARMQARLLALRAEWAFGEAERQRMAGSPPDIDSDQFFGLILNVDLKSGTLRVESDPNNPEDGELALRAVQELAPALAASRIPDATAMAALTTQLQNLPQQPAVANGRKLSEVAHDFIRTNAAKWAKRTVGDYQATLNLFIKSAGDVPIRTVLRKTVHDFKVALTGTMALRTLDKKILIVHGLFRHATSSGDYVGDNPASRQVVLRKADKRKLKSYKPFTEAQLKVIFNPKTFLKHNCKPHQFWAPLIGLYSGARIEEICQLLISDIREVEGMYCFDIKDDSDLESVEQSVKTEASKRLIPVHSKLIELGFLEYIADVKKIAGNSALLFPYLIKTVNGYSKTTGANFGKYLDKLGLTDPLLVFHSFRSTVNNKLKHSGIDEEKRCQLIGHEHDNVNSAVYSTPYNAIFLQAEVMPKVEYPEIDLASIRYDSKIFKPMLEAEMSRRLRSDRHIAASLKINAKTLNF